ncbi:MAG: Uma2 family endonuclease [Myxococcota bacterium]
MMTTRANEGFEEAYRLLPEPPPGGWLSDEPEMENYAHLMQMVALIATFKWLWRGRTDRFVAGNLTVYFSPVQKKSRDFRGPDLFVVLDVDATKKRNSWVVWEEGGRYPDVIFELLSPSTAETDRGAKKDTYQNIFRTPEYFLFDPETATLEGYALVAGRYQSLSPDAEGKLISQVLDLKLGVVGQELRLFTVDGSLVPKPEESALEAGRRADEQQQRADEQQQRADEQQQRADEQQQRADEQQRRAAAAEAELAALKEKLGRPS